MNLEIVSYLSPDEIRAILMDKLGKELMKVVGYSEESVHSGFRIGIVYWIETDEPLTKKAEFITYVHNIGMYTAPDKKIFRSVKGEIDLW